MTLAGRVAQCRAGYGDVYPGGDLDDLMRAREMALLVSGLPETANELLAAAHDRAIELLSAPDDWDLVKRLAEALNQRGEMVFRTGSGQPSPVNPV